MMCLHSKEITAEQIRDRQWGAAFFVLGVKPAFEIPRPDVIRAQPLPQIAPLHLKSTRPSAPRQLNRRRKSKSPTAAPTLSINSKPCSPPTLFRKIRRVKISEMSKIVLEAGRVATEKMLDYYQRMGIKVTHEMTLAPEKPKPKRKHRKKRTGESKSQTVH
jgi:hypothetical protein